MRRAPPTSSGQMPPGTGLRTGTGMRMRTGAAPPTASREAAYGVALTHEVNVDNRPVTQQGMSGMRTSQGAGPGRLVQDGSFFLGQLRQKIMDIQRELAKLKAEGEQHTKDSSQYGGLERTYETLLAEVKNLEGTLADHNLAMDKARTTADPGEVVAYLSELEDRNRRNARELDNVFLSKQERERAVADVEQAIAQVHREMEGRVNAMDPQKLEEYRGLVQRSQQLEAEVASVQAETDAMTARIKEHEARMGPKGGSYRQEYKDVEREVGRLRRQRDALAADIELASMEPKAAREKLLAKVKADQDRSKDLDRRSADTASEMEKMRAAVAEAEADARAGRSGAGEIDPSKVEVLQRRDAEMSEFIDRFDATRAGVLQEQSRAQEAIVALLAHISSGLEAQHTIPEQAQVTMRRLQGEKEKRLAEMAKIDTLDEKIPVELKSLRDKVRGPSCSSAQQAGIDCV
ncbi:intraflagellar transport protein 74 [Tribonema minus]|uniref:Intraflagellar transport protein 74 n=1 Tax=Tribonema minus TaxID=303371 RepID=A0A836CE00_9STRA|nr:intraflagellar transport protein 74 [Tribonema minus]